MYRFIWNPNVCWLHFLWTLNLPLCWSFLTDVKESQGEWAHRRPCYPCPFSTENSQRLGACLRARELLAFCSQSGREKSANGINIWKRGKQADLCLPSDKRGRKACRGQWWSQELLWNAFLTYLPSTSVPLSQSAVIGKGSFFHEQKLLGSLIRHSKQQMHTGYFRAHLPSDKFSSLCNKHPLMCTLD